MRISEGMKEMCYVFEMWHGSVLPVLSYFIVCSLVMLSCNGADQAEYVYVDEAG